MSSYDTIVATKLSAPRTGVRLIERARLLEKFCCHRQTKLTLISAPAGYGKTVLASQFVSQMQLPFVWYQLDHFDNDRSIFLQHLLAGIEKHLPGLATDIAGMTGQQQSPEAEMRRLTTALVNRLADGLPQGLVLVFDDYHSLSHDAAVHLFMEQFLDYLPVQIHVIISSRTVPPLQLARLKVAGLMTEIQADDLRFTLDEVGSFLHGEKNEPVSGQTIAFLMDETNGWPAALRLAGLSLAGGKIRQKGHAGPAPSHRREIYQYLAGEVLGNLPEELTRFMVATSVLDILTPELCDRLLGQTGSAEILEALESQNLLAVYPEEEEEVYRCHHLFREFLQSRLGESRRGLMQKAGESYLHSGYPVRAVESFLDAGDYGRAMDAIEQVGGRMLLHSRWQTVRRWLQQIPGVLKEKRPWMLLFEGALMINSGWLEQAETFIGRAWTAFEQTNDADGLFHTQLCRARIYRSRGDYEDSLEILASLLPELFRRPIAQWYDVVLEHSLVLSMRGEIEKAKHLLNQSLTIAEREGQVIITAQLAERLGELCFLQGNYSCAVSVHQRASEIAPEQDRMSFLLRDSIATIYHDWGDLDQALEYAQKSIKAKEQLGMAEALPYAYQQLAMIYSSMGNIPAAEESYRRSIELAGQLGGETFFLIRSKALYGRFLGAVGRLEEGRRMVDEAMAEAQEQSPFLFAICRQAAAPVYIRMGELQEATGMLEEAKMVLERLGARYAVCVTCAVLSWVYRQAGRDGEADEMALQSLALAAPENCLQLFLSNPEMTLPILRAGLLHGKEPDFVRDIIDRLGSVTTELLTELASHRDPSVRKGVVAPLARQGGEKAMAMIRGMMGDSNEEVRDAAIAVYQSLAKEGEAGTVQTPAKSPPASRFGRDEPLYVQCLGPFSVLKDGGEVVWRTTKARDLFAYLLHHREKPVLKERIIDDIWPETGLEQSSTLFHTNLYQLRKALKAGDGRQPVIHKGGQYRLDPEMMSTDLEQFLALARLQETEALEKAVALYRGEYLEGLDYAWVLAEREQLSQVYLSVLDRLAHIYAGQGEWAGAATCLRAILRTNPLLEDAHAFLMTAYARMGDRLAVMQQYETLTHLLEQELGIDPSPKTRELYYRLCSEEE
jgi:LuxR family transcriptional regulator, maltose regulon positive regulatory protein